MSRRPQPRLSANLCSPAAPAKDTAQPCPARGVDRPDRVSLRCLAGGSQHRYCVEIETCCCPCHRGESVAELRWEHDGRPCAARSQSLWRPGNLDITRLCRFVPEGEQLPAADPAGKWAPTDFDDTGFPVQLGWRSPGALNEQIARVRAHLAAEADGDS